MKSEDSEELWVIGKDLMYAKYFSLGMATIGVLDYFLTLGDEVTYIWKKRRSWMFYAFLLNRYSLLVFILWQQMAFQWLGYTQKMCDRSVRLEGFYLVFVFTIAQGFLTMRLYALTAQSRVVLCVFSVLIAGCVGMGLYMVFNPQTRAAEIFDVPLPAFHMCGLDAPLWTEWAYVGSVAICDLAAFTCVLAFIIKIKSALGQRHTMSHLMRTLIRDSSTYFFIVLTFSLTVLVYAVMARASLKNFPLVAPVVLVPVMVSRIILSLREAADEGLVLYWNGDHLTIDRWNDTSQEMTNLRFSYNQNARGIRTEVTTA